jgi:hypothetical protein
VSRDFLKVRCMTAHSSFSEKSYMSGCTDQPVWNEWGSMTNSFGMSGSSDQLFHMSRVTEYPVISYPIGLWELYFRSSKLAELHMRAEIEIAKILWIRQNEVFSNLSSYKKSGYPIPLIAKERKIETSSDTWARAVTHLVRNIGEKWSPILIKFPTLVEFLFLSILVKKYFQNAFVLTKRDSKYFQQ